MLKLLLIEDDEACAYTIQGGLELIGGYDVIWAKNGQEGWNRYNQIKPDVVVSDIDMPLMDGFQLAERIRKTNLSVIIILETGKTSPKDVVNGFQVGVDDYIKKPFVAEELHVRILSILKKTGKGLPQVFATDSLRLIGNSRFDVIERTLEFNRNKIKLTPREAEILKLLSENKNKVVARDALLALCWRESDTFSSRSLDVFMSKLRKYLACDSSIKLVTVKGEGIMLKVN